MMLVPLFRESSRLKPYWDTNIALKHLLRTEHPFRNTFVCQKYLAYFLPRLSPEVNVDKLPCRRTKSAKLVEIEILDAIVLATNMVAT